MISRTVPVIPCFQKFDYFLMSIFTRIAFSIVVFSDCGMNRIR